MPELMLMGDSLNLLRGVVGYMRDRSFLNELVKNLPLVEHSRANQFMLRSIEPQPSSRPLALDLFRESAAMSIQLMQLSDDDSELRKPVAPQTLDE